MSAVVEMLAAMLTVSVYAIGLYALILRRSKQTPSGRNPIMRGAVVHTQTIQRRR